MNKFLLLVILLLFLAGCLPRQVESTPVVAIVLTQVNPTTTSSIEQGIATSIPPSPEPPASLPPSATSFPDSASMEWKLFADGFNRPVDLAQADKDSFRIFIVEQAGLIRVIENGAALPDPYLDIRDRVGSQDNEQGLLGVAFHPKFTQNGFFFVNYTDLNGNTVIARFQINPGESVVNPASEKILLKVDQPYSNHNGGQLVFGPDGYLWIGLGDGGKAGDPLGNGQATDTLLGKMLRIDPNNGDPYTIPADNPFASSGGLPEIWATGLRNPWRFSFDTQTGDLYIADVGQNKFEEINFLPANFRDLPANFGWNLREAAHPYKNIPQNGGVIVDPAFEYGHDQGCSVTGGFVYRGKWIPDLNGIYIFGDYCSGKIWGMARFDQNNWQTKELWTVNAKIASFGMDAMGEIYLLDLGGAIYKLTLK